MREHKRGTGWLQRRREKKRQALAAMKDSPERARERAQSPDSARMDDKVKNAGYIGFFS